MKSDLVEEELFRVCKTCFLTAGLRAIDYDTNRVCDDMYAKALGGPHALDYAGKMLDTIPLYEHLSLHAYRTRKVDELVKKYCEEHDLKQVLILACGLDSRAYRLSVASRPVFYEVDTEPVIDYKTNKVKELGIKPITRVVSIVHDLRDPGLKEKLVDNGFDVDAKTFVIIEGLFEYLENEDRIGVLKRTSELVPSGSFVLCTTPSKGFGLPNESVFGIAARNMKNGSEMLKPGVDDLEGEILQPAGFKLLENHHSLQAAYFGEVDETKPHVKEYMDGVREYEATGVGIRQQVYVGIKL